MLTGAKERRLHGRGKWAFVEEKGWARHLHVTGKRVCLLHILESPQEIKQRRGRKMKVRGAHLGGGKRLDLDDGGGRRKEREGINPSDQGWVKFFGQTKKHKEGFEKGANESKKEGV